MNEIIEKLVKEDLESRLNDYNFEILLKDILNDLINKEIKEKIESKINEMVSTEVESYIKNILDNELTINDGWSSKKYESFEVFFKSKLKESLENKYEIKNQIDRLVKERIRQIEDEKIKKIKDEIVEKYSNMNDKRLEE